MISIFAPAKLTLGFQVTGRRSDGYHLIESEMTMVDYGDDIELMAFFNRDHSRTTKVTVDDPLGLSKIGFNFGLVPTGPGNLLDKVASLYGKGVEARILKRIPVGGGLGGGSADAGALARYLFLSDDVDPARPIEDFISELAELGADVPVCFYGQRAFVHGIGDQVEVVKSKIDGEDDNNRRKFTLFLAPISVSTPEVYRFFDLGRSIDAEVGEFPNDLEGPALALSPALQSFRRSIASIFSVTPSLAGSGSTYFVSGHVIDRSHLAQRGFGEYGDRNGLRIVSFPDVSDASINYLACECSEFQVNQQT